MKCSGRENLGELPCTKCSADIPHCTECVNASICNRCNPGFFRLDSCGSSMYDTCVQCEQTNCNSGSFLKACTGTETELPCFSCAKHLSHCVECSNATVCTKCASDYMINASSGNCISTTIISG